VFRLLCKCGKYLEVPESLANKQIKCKHCGKVLTVPPPPKQAAGEKVDECSPFYLKGHRQCPGCGKQYPERIKICVGCGMDIDKGAMLYASLEGGEQSVPAAPPAPAEQAGLLPRLLRMFGIGRK
jgi:hypothetical protein